MIPYKTYPVKKVDRETRLADFAIGLFDELPTKSSVKKAIKSGRLQLKDQPTSTGTFIKDGMMIQLFEDDSKPIKEYKEDLQIIYQDSDLAVVNKPPGLITMGNQFRTLENMLPYNLEHHKESGTLKRPKPVHRLDSMTSGLVIIAKTQKALINLSKSFENREVKKTYHALVMGQTPEEGTIKEPIEDRLAETNYRCIQSIRSLKNGFLSLLKIHPVTGRTHQIRIHCASAGFPIYGDQLYAKETIKRKGLFLAATGLSFPHPKTQKILDITIELPANFYQRMKSEERRWTKYHSNG